MSVVGKQQNKCNADTFKTNIWFYQNYRKVLTGFEIHIEFERNNDENMLYTDVANPDYKVEFEDLSLILVYYSRLVGCMFKSNCHPKNMGL